MGGCYLEGWGYAGFPSGPKDQLNWYERLDMNGWGNPLQDTGRHSGIWPRRALRRAVLAAMAVALALPGGSPVLAADRVVPHIDGFGPYKLGMTLDQAKAADAGGKPDSCGDFAEGRQCLALKAEVFQEPAIIYAVLDPAGARVDRVVAKLDPMLTRRRAFRCVRLSEKVFALLVVVYGSRYKQSYDQERRPLPAVAWDGEETGRLIFEAKCRTRDEGNPMISVVERYPDGVKPPPVAAQTKPPATVDAAAATPTVPLPVENRAVQPPAVGAASRDVALAPRGDMPQPPVSAPVGIVEESALGAPDTSGAVEASERMALLTRELAHAKGRAEPAPADPSNVPTVPPSIPQSSNPTVDPAASAAHAAIPAPAAPEPQVAVRSEAASSGSDSGGYTIPLDIALPAADAGQPGITISEAPVPAPEATQAPGPAAEKTSVPPEVTVADPGPVTLPRPTLPPATAPAAAKPVASDVKAARQAVAETRPAHTAADPRSDIGAKGTAASVQTARRPAHDDTVAPAKPARVAVPSPVAAPATPPQPYRTASLPPDVRPPDYREAYEPREPTDLEAPEPLAMPEEEEYFRRLRDGGAEDAADAIDAAVQKRLAVVGPDTAAPPAPVPAQTTPPSARIVDSNARPPEQSTAQSSVQAPGQPAIEPEAGSGNASAAPVSLLSVARAGRETARRGAVEGRQPRDVPVAAERDRATTETSAISPARSAADDEKPAGAVPDTMATTAGERDAAGPAINPFAGGWGNAKDGGFSPVMSGGWRHKAPVPPVRPWRERADTLPASGSDA